MRDIEFIELYKSNLIKKNISIAFDNITIDNNNLYNDTFSMVQSICSQDNLRFGGCESSYVKFRIPNNYPPMKGKMLYISQIIEGKTIKLGQFKVDSDSSSSDKKYRDIIAYDLLYTIRNTDMTKWYTNTIFPITLKNLRDSFFDFFKIPQKSISLPNDSTIIYKVSSDNVGGGDIIKDICLMNGAFGRINEDGLFEYIYIEPDKSSAIEIEKKFIKNLSYEDFETHEITRIKLSQSDSDIDFYFGQGTNTYPLQLTILNVGTKTEALNRICANALAHIKNIIFTPINISCQGNLCLETGDTISAVDYSGNTIYSYILKRTFSINGVESLTDEYEASGTQFYTREQSNNSDAIYSTNQKISSITKNSFYSYTYTNNILYNIKDIAKEVIQINISATNYTDAIFIASIPLYMDNDGYVVVNYYKNKALIEGDTCKTYFNKGYNILTLCNYIAVQEDENLLLSVSLNTEYTESYKRIYEAKIQGLEKFAKNGIAYEQGTIDTSVPNLKILAQKIKAVCFTKGLLGTGTWDGTFILQEDIGATNIGGVAVNVSSIQDSILNSTQFPISNLWNILLGSTDIVGTQVEFDKTNLITNIDMGAITSQYVLDTSTKDIKFSKEFITYNDKFILTKQYDKEATEKDIDKGYLKVIELNYDDFKTVESVVIE